MNVRKNYLNDGRRGETPADFGMGFDPYVNEGPVGSDAFQSLIEKGIRAGKDYVSQKMNDSEPMSVLAWLVKKLLFEDSDTVPGSDEDGTEKFEYVGSYKGKPVYAGSNDSIREILLRYGDAGHEPGEVNYGAAFNDTIYINKGILPLEGIRDNVLEHEYQHLVGEDEDGARKKAEEITRVPTDVVTNTIPVGMEAWV